MPPEVRLRDNTPNAPERRMTFSFTTKDLTEWGSAALVFLTGAVTGHHLALGMTAAQGAGAVAAVLGSVTLAVAVRVWPAQEATGVGD